MARINQLLTSGGPSKLSGGSFNATAVGVEHIFRIEFIPCKENWTVLSACSDKCGGDLVTIFPRQSLDRQVSYVISVGRQTNDWDLNASDIIIDADRLRRRLAWGTSCTQ